MPGPGTPLPAGDPAFDLVIAGGHVVDPAHGRDGRFDVGIAGDRIVAVAPALRPGPGTEVVDATGRIVCPGLIDLHAHVYEHGTNFGLPVDEAGVHSGITTVVDMGSTGTWVLPEFRASVVATATTEVRAFLLITVVGLIQGKRGLPRGLAFSPDLVDVDAVVRAHADDPQLIRGVKAFCESFGYARGWDARLLELAREAADRAGLPLYVHTGQVLPIEESKLPSPEVVMDKLLELVRPGDVLGHCYSNMPDGILGRGDAPLPQLVEAVESGVRLDVGHGFNFAFANARRLLDCGLPPYTISSDAHGGGGEEHDDTNVGFSLVGTMSKLKALGLTLSEVVACTTAHPAEVLGLTDEIGTLGEGSRADVTILEERHEDWVFLDPQGDRLPASERLVPRLVVRAGRSIVPTGRLLRDVLTAEERGEDADLVVVGGHPG